MEGSQPPDPALKEKLLTGRGTEAHRPSPKPLLTLGLNVKQPHCQKGRPPLELI